MTAFEKLIGDERAQVVRNFVGDESVRQELRDAAKHAAKAARAGRGGGGLRATGLQRHGLEAVRSFERALDIARGGRNRRRRKTFLVLGAAAGAAGIAVAAAKAVL